MSSLPACERAMVDKYIYLFGIRSRDFDGPFCSIGKDHHRSSWNQHRTGLPPAAQDWKKLVL